MHGQTYACTYPLQYYLSLPIFVEFCANSHVAQKCHYNQKPIITNECCYSNPSHKYCKVHLIYSSPIFYNIHPRMLYFLTFLNGTKNCTPSVPQLIVFWGSVFHRMNHSVTTFKMDNIAHSITSCILLGFLGYICKKVIYQRVKSELYTARSESERQPLISM